MNMKRKFYVPLGRLYEWKERTDADLYLIKPGKRMFSDLELIKFTTRKALEEFNKRAGLKALIQTQVPINHVIYAHESDSEARKVINNG